MPAASVSAATIERLSRIESVGESVLCVYLDLDPAAFRRRGPAMWSFRHCSGVLARAGPTPNACARP